jgi:hypothetical protein
MKPNERSGVDAGTVLGLHIGRRWPGATHRERWGHVTRMDLYVIAAYSNSGFRNEPEAQQLVTSRMKAKERRMLRLTVSSPASCASALPLISTR